MPNARCPVLDRPRDPWTNRPIDQIDQKAKQTNRPKGQIDQQARRRIDERTKTRKNQERHEKHGKYETHTHTNNHEPETNSTKHDQQQNTELSKFKYGSCEGTGGNCENTTTMRTHLQRSYVFTVLCFACLHMFKDILCTLESLSKKRANFGRGLDFLIFYYRAVLNTRSACPG